MRPAPPARAIALAIGSPCSSTSFVHDIHAMAGFIPCICVDEDGKKVEEERGEGGGRASFFLENNSWKAISKMQPDIVSISIYEKIIF